MRGHFLRVLDRAAVGEVGGSGTCGAVVVPMPAAFLLGLAIETALAATLLLRGLTFWLPMVPGLWLAMLERQQENLTKPDIPAAIAKARSRQAERTALTADLPEKCQVLSGSPWSMAGSTPRDLRHDGDDAGGDEQPLPPSPGLWALNAPGRCLAGKNFRGGLPERRIDAGLPQRMRDAGDKSRDLRRMQAWAGQAGE